MLLALDARNGAVNAGFRAGGRWLSIMRFGADRSADEYAFLLEAAASRARQSAEVAAPGGGADPGGGDARRVTAAWISSVVPALTPALAAAVAIAFGLEARVVGPGVRTGVKIRTDNPAEVGSDLVCAAAAAWTIAGGACVAVDFGAALTAIAVNERGELLGAAIAPGPAAAAAALRASAVQLPEVRLEAPDRAIGRNTVQAVRSGIVLGYGGLVSRLVELMRVELGGTAALLGSGDQIGRDILAGMDALGFQPDLALDGLALIAERNDPSVDTGRDYPV